MRSFSSGPRGNTVTPRAATEISEWTPEAISSGVVTAPGSPELRGAARLAVEQAVREERALAEEREAELLANEARNREMAVNEAYQRGHAEGRDEGERAEAARLRAVTAAAEEALETLREGEIRWTGAIEENIAALAVVIARQIIGRELKADEDAFADLLRNALKEFPIDQPVRIRISPGDLNTLGSIGAVDADPFRQITGEREARWLADPSIAPGGCMVEGRERIIDGRVDTALERVYRRLTYTNA